MQILISRHTPAPANIVLGFIPPELSLLNLSKECAPSIFTIPSIASPPLSWGLKIAPTSSERPPDPGDLCPFPSTAVGNSHVTAFSPPKTATVGGELCNLQTPLRNCESRRRKTIFRLLWATRDSHSAVKTSNIWTRFSVNDTLGWQRLIVQVSYEKAAKVGTWEASGHQGLLSLDLKILCNLEMSF